MLARTLRACAVVVGHKFAFDLPSKKTCTVCLVLKLRWIIRQTIKASPELRLLHMMNVRFSLLNMAQRILGVTLPNF